MSRLTPEGRFKERLLERLEREFPGCMILWGNSAMRQGIPDILVLYKHHWAMLEAKKSENAEHQPNQDFYVDILDDMSYAAFVFPENLEGVISDLQRAFGT
jgi:hypothetical protein